MKPDPIAGEAFQKKASFGSFDPADPDRKQWDFETELETEYEYSPRFGSTAFVKFKGRRADGEKVYVTGRPFKGGSSEYAMAVADDPRSFFSYPGLTHVLKGKGGARDILFRLPELLRDCDDPARKGEPIYIPEGEKDVETLRALGLIATTNPDGWRKWNDSYGEYLRGREVVLLLDNDRNGKRRGEELPVRLWRFAKSIKVILLPDLPPKGDVTDWLKTGRLRDDLLKIVEEAEFWQPFACDDDGVPYKSPANARKALDVLGVTVKYNEFAHCFTVEGLPKAGPLLEDKDVTRLRIEVQERCGLIFAKDAFWEYVTDYAHRRTYHPVREYLDAVQGRWDGTPRLDTWLVRYGGAEDSDYVRAVGSLSLLAAVRRVRQPGCKFDEITILEGKQGVEKSTALSVLAGEGSWFTDGLSLGAAPKEVIELLSGSWIVEFAEMDGIKKNEIESVKAMVSRRTDKARPAYGRLSVERPRQCVFFGSTNSSKYLRDTTGNRRFWPVAVQPFDIEALRGDRDQIWAEAATREAKGESIRLARDLWSVAAEHQARREVDDAWAEVLADRLEGLEGKVQSAHIWELCGLSDPSRRSQHHNDRLPVVMEKLGWTRPPSKLRFRRTPDGSEVDGGGTKPCHAWIKGDASIEVTRDDLFPM